MADNQTPKQEPVYSNTHQSSSQAGLQTIMGGRTSQPKPDKK